MSRQLSEATTETRAETTDPEFSPETDASTAPSGRTIAKDDGFHVLQNARRRAVLRYLLARRDREQFRMRTLAEAVAAWEHDTSVEQLDSDERQRVYIALYQSHLPKLDDHDVINYDQSRGVVEPQPLLDAFDDYVDEGLEAANDRLVVGSTGGSERTNGSGTVTDRLLHVMGG